MSLKQFLISNAVLFVPFGLVMLAIPGLFFPMVGLDLDPDGILMARVSGSGLLNFGIMCYLVRNENNASTGLKAILIGNLIFHGLDAISTFIASFSGVMNTLGWLFCGLHFILAIGFLFFLQKLKVPKIA
ncbi:hypothetical protein [Maribacter halichondriae]|uniref:hypothetical protein n=1 Tax=Maribacter halichondriae TaxID=2980554 RepID=UPI0023599D24|nr:hypothetical protein [Maribacter sp. Hal144]